MPSRVRPVLLGAVLALGLVAGEANAVSVTDFALPSGAGPVGLTEGPDGHLWYADDARGLVGRMALDGTVLPSVVPLDGAAAPLNAITRLPGRPIVAFTHGGRNRVGYATGDEVGGSFAFSSLNANPSDVVAAAGSDSVWVTEYGANRVALVGEQIERDVQLPHPNSNPLGIAEGPDGAIWFTEFTGNRIGRIPANGTATSDITEFTLPTADAMPSRITRGPDGALWFTEFNANKIGRITRTGQITEFPIPTPNSQPNGITLGPDGALWFTELGGRKIGRITPDGAITEYPVPGNREPALITAASAAAGSSAVALWFSERLAGRIGRVLPDRQNGVRPATFSELRADPGTCTTATLRGTVDPNGSPASAYFDYGANPNALDRRTSEISQVRPGLLKPEATVERSADQTLFWILRADNGAGISSSAIQELAPARTYDDGLVAVRPKDTTATFDISLRPYGARASVVIEVLERRGDGVLTRAGETSPVTLDQSPALASASVSISGLTPSTEYVARMR